MHPATEMETTMKTAKAAQTADRSSTRPVPLQERYGEIGISAVAAAARFNPAPRPAQASEPASAGQPWRQVVAMD